MQTAGFPVAKLCSVCFLLGGVALVGAGNGTTMLGPQKPSAAATSWLEQQKTKISSRDAELLRRGQETLYANILDGQWRPLRGISPSPFQYRGVWNWDGAFHAMAVSHWDATLAREQIQIILDRQLPSGGFCDVVWEKEGAVDAFGKPPVLSWVCEIMDRRKPDDEYLKRIYPKFAANATFWERERGGDKDGLFHYDGPAPHYEAGWDNSVRWDNGCANLWAIDLNCYMIMTYRSLAYMADRLRLPEDKRKWLDKAAGLGKRINDRLWSDTDHAYMDRDRVSQSFTGVLTPASFMPLYVRIATPQRAKAMNDLAKDPKKFFPGMPSVSYDNQEFKSDIYWRGPMWLNISYMALKGLKRAGYNETAQAGREQLLTWCHQNQDHLWEYYDSKSGKGIGAPQYGWTAAFVIEFICSWNSDDEP